MKAEVVFQTGKWYLGRGKHQAAMIYFNSILKDYSGTKWAVEARKILMRLRPEAAVKGS
jgi:outer membrane protein assembly factor BamD (BamD/ComL family)